MEMENLTKMNNSINSNLNEKESSVNDNLKENNLEETTDVITSNEITHNSDMKNANQNTDETKYEENCKENEENLPKSKENFIKNEENCKENDENSTEKAGNCKESEENSTKKDETFTEKEKNGTENMEIKISENLKEDSKCEKNENCSNNDNLENSQIQKSEICIKEPANIEKNLQNNLNDNKTFLNNETKFENQKHVNIEQMNKNNSNENECDSMKLNLSNEQITEKNENSKFLEINDKIKENSLKVQNELKIENKNENLNKSKNELLENQELEIKITNNRLEDIQLETEFVCLENDKLNLNNFQSETNVNCEVLKNETKSCLELDKELKSSEIQEIKKSTDNNLGAESTSKFINLENDQQSKDESESGIDLTKSAVDENNENDEKNKSKLRVRSDLGIDEKVENLYNDKMTNKSDIESTENEIHLKNDSVTDNSKKESGDEKIQDNTKLQIISSDKNCKEKEIECEIEEKSESGIELDESLTDKNLMKDEISSEKIKSLPEESKSNAQKSEDEKDKIENECVMDVEENDDNDSFLKAPIVNETLILDNMESIQTNENTNLINNGKTTIPDIEDPLSLDNDLTEKSEDFGKIPKIERNLPLTMTVFESNAINLTKPKEPKNQESLNKASVDDKESRPLQKSGKSTANYIVKTNPLRSFETIELLDSDDEDDNHKDNNDNEKIISDNSTKRNNKNDDDIILVSEKGLNKITKSKKSTSSVSSSKPMFAISSVQSFGKKKVSCNVNSTMQNQLNTNELKEDKIDIYNAIKNLPDLSINRTSNENTLNRTNKNSTSTETSPSEHTVTIKKNGISSSSSINNEYQATLRVRSPVKEPETLNTKDFLSAFQNFSANNLPKLCKSPIKITKRHVMPSSSSSSSSSLLATSCKSNINNTNVQIKKMNNNSFEDEMCKEWLKNFIKNLLNPTQTKSKFVLEILQKCLSPERYFQMKILIDNHKDLDNAFIYIVREKVLKLLNDGRTIEKFVLVVKSVNDVNIDEMNQEIYEMFIKNNVITDIGYKLYEMSLNKNNYNKVLTTDSRNGNITCKSNRKPIVTTICNDNNGTGHDNGGKNDNDKDYDGYDDDDEEYSPSVTIDVDENKKQERRKSLRRDSKSINWKQYFTFDNEDDDVIIEKQINKKSKNDKKTTKRLSPSKCYEDDLTNEIPERKKVKIEDNTSIQTPFDTDLLTPMWFETDDPVEENNTKSQTKNLSKSRRKSNYHSSSTLSNRHDETVVLSENVEKDDTSNSVASIEEKIIIKKNTNPIYHCSSKFIDSCLLCGEKVQHTVSHYVNEHSDREVIISRLPQCDIDYMLQNINYAFISNQKDSLYGRTHQYTSKCIFCKREMNVGLRYWWEHFSMHTGEYNYECTGCKTKRSRKQAVQTHIQGTCKKGRRAKVKEIYDFDRSITEIQCYVCILCNYIQLHRINVEKHLRNEHDMNVYEIELNIIRGILIQFSKPYVEPDELEQQRQQQQLMLSSFSSGTDTATTTLTAANYMNYTNFLQSSDDLSFMICNMLASDDIFDSSLNNSNNSNVPQSSHNAHNLTKNEGK